MASDADARRAAMIGSGVAFYLVSGIWRPFDPRGWGYAVHRLAWTIAYLPGLAALTPELQRYRRCLTA